MQHCEERWDELEKLTLEASLARVVRHRSDDLWQWHELPQRWLQRQIDSIGRQAVFDALRSLCPTQNQWQLLWAAQKEAFQEFVHLAPAAGPKP